VSRRGLVLFAAMGVIWGIPYLLIKVSVAAVTPASLVFIRTAVGALLLLPFALSRGDLRAVLTRWRVLLVYTAVEIGVPWLMLSDAERSLTSSLTGLLVATVPLVGALLARFVRSGDRLAPVQVAGLLVGLAGVAAVVGVDLAHGSVRAFGEMTVVVVCYAVGPVIIARRLGGVPALGVVAVSLAFTALAYAPVGATQLPHAMPGWQVVAALAGLSVVCTAAAFLVFFALIGEIGPVRATIITYVNPAVALLLGVVLLHEPFTPGAGLGFALILAGSYLATRRRAPSSAAAAEAQAALAASRRQPA
jgi:drug/metabolite transporter (DMT)-like permease